MDSSTSFCASFNIYKKIFFSSMVFKVKSRLMLFFLYPKVLPSFFSNAIYYFAGSLILPFAFLVVKNIAASPAEN